jgi:hypothetical protein
MKTLYEDVIFCAHLPRDSTIFIPQSVLLQVGSFFPCEFSTQSDLVLSLSIFSTLSFP